MTDFSKVLKKVCLKAQLMGLIVIDSSLLNSFYKGDMDGQHIWTSSDLDDEEELFNVLHMIGHSIQWNVSDNLRQLGSVLHKDPDDELLRKLQEYEWEANCYALSVLHSVGERNLDIWLYDNYQKDMYYLTHFYKTGETLKEITPIALKYSFIKLLIPKELPQFTPVASQTSRDGLVINFQT